MPDATRSKPLLEEAEEREADGVGRRAVDRVARSSRRPASARGPAAAASASSGGPTADWFVSGATTVTSPIGSSACLRARMPARLDAVVVGDQDPRPGGPVAERPPDALAAPACRRASPATRLAALHVDVAPLGAGALPGHVRDALARSDRVPVVLAHAPASGCSRGLGQRGRGRSAAPATSSTSSSTPGTGSRGRRTCRPSRAATRCVARSATDPPFARPAEPVEEERRQHGRDRDPEDGARRCPRSCRR